MELLERQLLLDQLSSFVDAAGAGRGGLVFVGGQAGVGKSCLVRRLLELHADTVRGLVGRCDPLVPPRPLGPLLDVAGDLDPELAVLLSTQAPRFQVLSRMMQSLGCCSVPDLLVIEDAQWADEATLDVLRFVGRRLGGVRVLVVVTYRDDETADRHPLRVVLGDLATTAGVYRLSVAPLSAGAVAVMCRTAGREPGDMHVRTGGNPFYVSECLAGEPGSVPATVVDAVLARAARLSDAAWAALETVAVAGSATTTVLGALPAVGAEVLHECRGAGLLVAGPRGPTFRHELSRLAVLAAVPEARRVAVHTRLLAALRRAGAVELTLLVHHAEGAGDGSAVRDYGPRAAAEAAQAGAHREAAAHYLRVLHFSAYDSAAARAALVERLAEQHYLGGQPEDALAAWATALELWARLGDPLRQGDALHRVARLQQLTGRTAEAEASAAEATRLLEGLRPGPELARAYNTAAWLNLVNSRLREAVRLAERAAALAIRVRDEQTLVHARITGGAARLQSYDDDGRHQLKAAYEQARSNGWEEHAGRALWNLAIISVWQRRGADAQQALDIGAAYCHTHGLESWAGLLRAAQGRWLLDRGLWDRAVADARAVLALAEPVLLARVLALSVAGRVASRRGEAAAAAQLLHQAADLSARQPEMEPFAPIHSAIAEQVWLAGDRQAALAAVTASFDAVRARNDRWELGESCYWLWRLGVDPRLDASSVLALPYALLLAGDTGGAAVAWDELECPYERAEALALSDDPAAVLAALDIFDTLGAAPAAGFARRQLRALGVSSVPRGPLLRTRNHPLGLTAREAEVLELVGHGLTNQQIADHLFLSVKTVERHVSAALRKTGGASRAEAARLAGAAKNEGRGAQM